MIGSKQQETHKRRCIGRVLCVGVLLVVLLVRPAALPVEAQESPWQPLSPVVDTGYANLELYGVAPTWPQDRVLFMISRGWLARTDDNGATWVRLPARFSNRTLLQPAPGVDRSGIVLAIDEPEGYDRPATLARSADRGATWTTVLTPPRSLFAADEPKLTFTPSFQDDGLAFLRIGQRLYRTIDFGASWTQIDVNALGASKQADGIAASGQLVLQATLSPAFAEDRTIFAVVATAPYYPYPAPQSGNDFGPQAPPLHHLTSLGLIVSRDGGASWQWASDGLAVGGTPYRFVTNLAVSPTYAQDQTIFVLAWGGAERYHVEDQQRLEFATALFRSQNRGRTWEAIWDQPATPTDATSLGNQSSRLTLSPTFADDGTAEASFRSGSRIRDDSSLRLPAGRLAELAARCDGWRTTDAGASWTHIDDCPALRRPLGGAGPTPIAGADGVALAMLSGQIVARGIDAPATPGVPTCPIAPDATFEPISARDSSEYRQLGCPTEPARSVRMLERSVGSRRGLWPVDDTDSWLLIRGDGRSLGLWESRPKATEAWTGPPDAELDTIVQPYWGGRLIRLARADGTASFLQLGAPTPSEPTSSYIRLYDAEGKRP